MNTEGVLDGTELATSCCSGSIGAESGAPLPLLAWDTLNSPRDRKAFQVPSKQGDAVDGGGHEVTPAFQEAQGKITLPC